MWLVSRMELAAGSRTRRSAVAAREMCRWYRMGGRDWRRRRLRCVPARPVRAGTVGAEREWASSAGDALAVAGFAAADRGVVAATDAVGNICQSPY